MLKQYKQNVEILEEDKITYFDKSLSLTNSRFHRSWIIRRLLKGTVSVISWQWPIYNGTLETSI